MCTEHTGVVKRDVSGYPGGGGGRRWRGLCGGGNREQKNTRFFVQVNISARGPCLTGNAPSDPFWTHNWEGSCLPYDHLHSYSTGGAPGAPTIVREENYFIFHVRWLPECVTRWDIFSHLIFTSSMTGGEVDTDRGKGCFS